MRTNQSINQSINHLININNMPTTLLAPIARWNKSAFGHVCRWYIWTHPIRMQEPVKRCLHVLQCCLSHCRLTMYFSAAWDIAGVQCTSVLLESLHRLAYVLQCFLSHCRLAYVLQCCLSHCRLAYVLQCCLSHCRLAYILQCCVSLVAGLHECPSPTHVHSFHIRELVWHC